MPIKVRRTPKRNSSDDPEEFRATLAEHLDELRTRIMRSLMAVVGGWVVGWYVEPLVYEHLSNLVESSFRKSLSAETEFKEVFLNATDAFMLKLKLSFMIGLILALPVVTLQFWGFVKPGLKQAEQKPLKIVAPISVFLFLLGSFFCWLILPAAFQWFVSFVQDFPGAALHQQVGTMVFFVLKMLLAFGVGFQLPLVVFVLGKLGIIGPDTLIQYWRQATVGIFFASAILTPSQDIFSMMMMAVPLTLLFMLSVVAVRVTSREPHPPELDDLD